MKKTIIPNDYREVTDVLMIQALLFKLFKIFHKICEENNLIYSAFGGTLLGTIRHGTMIPWDDDIDVSMPREDYNKLIRIVKKDGYKEVSIFSYPKKNYIYSFAKFSLNNTLLVERLRDKYSFLKLNMDIFPVDGYPLSNSKKYFRKLKRCKNETLMCVKRLNPPLIWWKKLLYPVKVIQVLCYRFIGYKYFVRRRINIESKLPFAQSDLIFCNGNGWWEKGKMTKTEYLNRKLYDFGDTKIWGMINYHDHLTNLYGNYMQLPPLEKRISNHSYRLYVKINLLGETDIYE